MVSRLPQPNYEEAKSAYKYLSGLKEELDSHRKKSMFERVGFGRESESYLEKLQRLIHARELISSLPLEMKRRLEEELKVKDITRKVDEFIFENLC